MRKELLQLLQLMDLSTQSAGRKRIDRTIDTACLIEKELIVGKLIKGSAMRVAGLIGPNIDKGMDQQVQLARHTVIYESAGKDSAENVEVLKVCRNNPAAVAIMVAITVIMCLRRNAMRRHGKKDCAEKQGLYET